MIWSPRASHSKFKFKYNRDKYFRRLGRPTFFYNIKRMFLLVGRLLQSDKTKVFVKYLASSSFEFQTT